MAESTHVFLLINKSLIFKAAPAEMYDWVANPRGRGVSIVLVLFYHIRPTSPPHLMHSREDHLFAHYVVSSKGGGAEGGDKALYKVSRWLCRRARFLATGSLRPTSFGIL